MSLFAVQQFFLYGGYVVSSLLFAAAISKRKTHQGYFLLCWILVFVSVRLTLIFIVSHQPTGRVFPFVINLMELVLIPLIYFYVVYFTNPPKDISKKLFQHFSIYLILAALFLWSILTVFNPDDANLQIHLGRYGTLLVAIPYYILILRTVKKFEQSIKEQLSDVSRIHLAWLRLLLAIYFLNLALNVVDVLTKPEVAIWKIAPVISTLSIFALIFFSIKQSRVFEESAKMIKELEPSATDIMSSEELAKYKDKLLRFLDEAKPYLNPHITLRELSGGIGLKPYKVSFLINNSFKTNFYNLINSKRIEHAKKLLENSGDNNILEIAIESGFNSKSVFNDAFKKWTGMTPKDFRSTIRPSR